MILTCPICLTRYQADAANFPPAGRDVRCARCGNVWHQPGPEPEAVPQPVIAAPEPAPSVYEAPPRPQSFMQRPSFEVVTQEQLARPRSSWLRRIFLGVGWIALIAILAAIGWTAMVDRQTILSAWPQSASVYSALGFKPSLSGLRFDDVAYHQVIKNGQPMLLVTGKLVNVSDHAMAVPQVRVTLSGDDHRELYHWTFVPAVISLRPGQTSAFVTRLASPPTAARHLDLRFAKAGE
jgi:predicted Zn finger-like uncharacterized protein